MIYLKLILFIFKVNCYRIYYLIKNRLENTFCKSSEHQLEVDWISQTHGKINHFNPRVNKGQQPIRVLRNILIHMFVNFSGIIKYEILVLVWRGKINGNLDFQIGNEPIFNFGRRPYTPHVGLERTLKLYETYLSYMWCVCYSNYTLFLQWLSFPLINNNVGYEKYKIDESESSLAIELFQYGVSLIKAYTPWDKEVLPNPEIYLAENRNLIEQSNALYVEALKFVLFHEYIHIREHLHYIDLGVNLDNNQLIEIEKEADEKSIEIVLGGITSDSHKIIVEFGILLGHLSLFYFSPRTKAIKHPDTEDRLTRALEKLNLDDYSDVWGLACVGLELWNRQFSLGFNWTHTDTNFKDLYYKIVSDIKSLP